MGKFLRVLVILLCVLAGGALFLGCMLFARRELLKARTQVLEERFIEIAAYVEQTHGTMDPKPTDPARDTSPCEADILDSPERSDYWGTYKYDLEITEPDAMMDLDVQRDDLMRYYLRDRFTGQPILDASGFPQTEGDEANRTMYNVLEEFKDKVSSQLDLLNETREQLRALRDEHITTINELNERKGFLRERLVEIVNLKAKIVELEAKIVELQEKIAELEAKIRELTDQIADLEREIQRLQEEIVDRDEKIRDLQLTITNLINKYEGEGRTATRNVDMIPGPKGTVLKADERWGFVAVSLSDACMMEMLGEELDAEQDPVGFEMYLERRYTDQPPVFVTKVALRWINRADKTAIFDISPGWTQTPIKRGDILYRHKSQSQTY